MFIALCMIDNSTTYSKDRPPGWDKGKKTGWRSDIPPGQEGKSDKERGKGKNKDKGDDDDSDDDESDDDNGKGKGKGKGKNKGKGGKKSK